MEQYIKKSAVVVEIEKRQRTLDLDSPLGRGGMVELQVLKDKLDTLEVKEVGIDLGDPKGDKSAEFIIDTKTLEVKEVDLEKELDRYTNSAEYVYNEMRDSYFLVAKHFFELGMQVRNKVQKGE